MTEKKRNLTDDDIEALAGVLEDRLASRFFGNLGRGLWGLAWKAILWAIIAIAAYGSIKGLDLHPPKG